MNSREFDSLKGSLLISRIVYAKMSAITGGVTLIGITLFAKVLFRVFAWGDMFDWGDLVVLVVTIGIHIHARHIIKVLVNIWGWQLLTVDQAEAFDLLHHHARVNLKQKEWS